MDDMSETVPDPDTWYWDQRNKKAYCCSNVDEDTVHLVSVWHREEFADALQEGALLPIDFETGIPGEIGPAYTGQRDTYLNIADSFRFLPEEVIEDYREAAAAERDES